MERPNSKPDFSGKLVDKRLEKRAAKLALSLASSRSSSIHGSTRDEASQKGFYRFLENERVSESHLVAGLTANCQSNVVDRDILVIQDTCSYGLNHLKGSVQPGNGLGLVGNKTGLGFLSHTSLVLDAHSEAILGYADIKLWNREQAKANNTTKRYKSEPIEEKESYKWIRASNQAKELLTACRSITIIQDREGDIYQQFCEVADQKTNLIIRSRDNRKLKDGSLLSTAIESSPVMAEILVNLTGDIRRESKSRTAQVEIKYCSVELSRPSMKMVSKELPASYKLFVLEVKEKNPPADTEALYWRLLTTLSLENPADAVLIIERYKQRWYIEQLFRLTKKQGFKIESTQLENGWAIRKLYVLVLGATIRVMQLYLAYEETESQDITEVFTDTEIECLQKIEINMKKTEKTTNLNDPKKLAWATWIIARLGGWKGNTNQRKPGPIILLKGLEKFDSIFEGWLLAKSFM